MEEVAKFISNLLNSRQQAHVYHWQAVGEGSNAVHEALNEYYDKIVKKVDGLVESIQGRNGIIRGYNLEFAVREDNKSPIRRYISPGNRREQVYSWQAARHRMSRG